MQIIRVLRRGAALAVSYRHNNRYRKGGRLWQANFLFSCNPVLLTLYLTQYSPCRNRANELSNWYAGSCCFWRNGASFACERRNVHLRAVTINPFSHSRFAHDLPNYSSDFVGGS